MPKYAGELRVGDIWTERPQGRAPHSYRVITIEPGLAPITVRVKAVSVITGSNACSTSFWSTGSRFMRGRHRTKPRPKMTTCFPYCEDFVSTLKLNGISRNPWSGAVNGVWSML